MIASDILIGVGALSLVSARAVLRTATGDEVAEAIFTDTESGVALSLERNCSTKRIPGEMHRTSRRPFPYFIGEAGYLAMLQAHAGDLRTPALNQNSMTQLIAVTGRFNVADLLAGAGAALIIRAGRDNFAHIPARERPRTGPDNPSHR